MKNPFSSKKKGGASFVVTRGQNGPYIASKTIRDNLGQLETKTISTKFDRVRHKDTKRSHIAMVFVYGYMLLVTLIVLGAPIYNAIVLENPEALDLERILAQIGTLIGAPLGFVIGYYFKEDK